MPNEFTPDNMPGDVEWDAAIDFLVYIREELAEVLLDRGDATREIERLRKRLDEHMLCVCEQARQRGCWARPRRIDQSRRVAAVAEPAVVADQDAAADPERWDGLS